MSSVKLIEEAEEWADGFGSDGQKNAGRHYERSMGVANILTQLIIALEKEEKLNATLKAVNDSMLSKAIKAIQEGSKGSGEGNHPEYNKGVDITIDWSIGVLESMQNKKDNDHE